MSDNTFSLQRLYLRNYRNLEDFTLDFDGKSVVLYGANSTGKTNIIQCISQILSHIIKGMSYEKRKPKIPFVNTDFNGESQLEVRGLFEFDDHSKQEYVFHARRDAIKRKLQTADPETTGVFFRSFSDHYIGKQTSFPIFAYYTMQRFVADIPARTRSKSVFDTNAPVEERDFREFLAWLKIQADKGSSKSLETIKYAVTSIMPELGNFYAKRVSSENCEVMDRYSLSLMPFSDSERCLFALVGDIVRRLIIANPGMNDPLLGGGMVLVDEVDLHLDPVMQRQIISKLHEIFPNVQFILTTHAPLVLEKLNEDFKIFELAREEAEVIVREVIPKFCDQNAITDGDFII